VSEQALGHGRSGFCLVDLGLLRRHEDVDTLALQALTAEILRDGLLRHPIVVDSSSLVILDGHHRVSALRDLGCRVVPAYLVDYRDPGITVGPWRPELPVTKDDVIRAGVLGRPYPPKTSRHAIEPPLAARPVLLAELMRR
jgi:hypothetical protein